jgi:hypothetical protein
MTRQCKNAGVSVMISVPPLAPKLLAVCQGIPTVRGKILIGGSQEGFASMEHMLKDPGDLFNENIDVMAERCEPILESLNSRCFRLIRLKTYLLCLTPAELADYRKRS